MPYKKTQPEGHLVHYSIIPILHSIFMTLYLDYKLA